MGSQWKFYFKSAGLAELSISRSIGAVQRADPNMPGLAAALRRRADGIETRVIEVEELSKEGVTLAEEVYDALEKTYAI